MTFSKNQPEQAFVSSLAARSARSIPTVSAGPQAMDQPSLQSLFRGSAAQQHHRQTNGVSLQLRDSFQKLGVQTDRPMLDILDEALGLHAAPASVSLRARSTNGDVGEPRQ